MSSAEESLYAERLRERLARNPDSKLFLALAEECRDRGQTDEAIALMVEGIQRNPDFVAARIALGRWYLSLNMPSEAKDEFTETVRRSPNSLPAHKWLAVAYKRLGDDGAAFSEYKKIVEIRPQNRVLAEARREIAMERLRRFLTSIQRHFSHPVPPSSGNIPQRFA